jgi:hypothetical protein
MLNNVTLGTRHPLSLGSHNCPNCSLGRTFALLISVAVLFGGTKNSTVVRRHPAYAGNGARRQYLANSQAGYLLAGGATDVYAEEACAEL